MSNTSKPIRRKEKRSRYLALAAGYSQSGGHSARQWGSRSGLPYVGVGGGGYFHGKKSKNVFFVIPAPVPCSSSATEGGEAGSRENQGVLDPGSPTATFGDRLRRGDGSEDFLRGRQGLGTAFKRKTRMGLQKWARSKAH